MTYRNSSFLKPLAGICLFLAFAAGIGPRVARGDAPGLLKGRLYQVNGVGQDVFGLFMASDDFEPTEANLERLLADVGSADFAYRKVAVIVEGPDFVATVAKENGAAKLAIYPNSRHPDGSKTPVSFLKATNYLATPSSLYEEFRRGAGDFRQKYEGSFVGVVAQAVNTLQAPSGGADPGTGRSLTLVRLEVNSFWPP